MILPLMISSISLEAVVSQVRVYSFIIFTQIYLTEFFLVHYAFIVLALKISPANGELLYIC